MLADHGVVNNFLMSIGVLDALLHMMWLLSLADDRYGVSYLLSMIPFLYTVWRKWTCASSALLLTLARRCVSIFGAIASCVIAVLHHRRALCRVFTLLRRRVCDRPNCWAAEISMIGYALRDEFLQQQRLVDSICGNMAVILPGSWVPMGIYNKHQTQECMNAYRWFGRWLVFVGIFVLYIPAILSCWTYSFNCSS